MSALALAHLLLHNPFAFYFITGTNWLVDSLTIDCPELEEIHKAYQSPVSL